jgi:hypothetical protein
VGAPSYSALVDYNAAQLESVTRDGEMSAAAAELAGALSGRWDPERCTWLDDGPTCAGSGRARSVEALLGVLVDPDERHVAAALGSLVDPSAHGARCGPTGVHRGEPAYSPTTYWRGPSWPQLTYLFWVAARRRGHHAVASALADALVVGAVRSGLAEFWHPDTGAGGGAVPQSWTALAWVVAEGAAGHG